jgi:hypothetical protein
VRRLIFGTMAVLLLAAGCGGEVTESKIPVDLDQVPAPVLEVARAKLPGYTLQDAFKVKFEGQDAFEVRGKNKQGKIREVEVSPAGKLLEVE